MNALSRRQFGKIAIASVPFGALLGPTRAAAAGHLSLGVSTYSFRDFPRILGQDNIDDVIRAIQAVHITDIELAFSNVEPAPPSTAPFMGGTPAYPQRIVLTPEQIASSNHVSRAQLREWRRVTPLTYFEAVQSKFAAAGLVVHACGISYDDSFTDAEIDATFRQAKAMGVSTISSAMTMATAQRLVPFAEQHQMSVAIHNQMAQNPAGAISGAQMREALRLSPAFRLKLDIGNLTASNGDAVVELGELQARVSHVLVRDRLRNGGASQPFGEGDTPITPVLGMLAAARTPIPALVEYDYAGIHSSVYEVAASVAYLSNARPGAAQ